MRYSPDFTRLKSTCIPRAKRVIYNDYVLDFEFGRYFRVSAAAKPALLIDVS